MFAKKPSVVRRGERTKVLSKFSNSLDMTYRFQAEPVAPADNLSGTVEVSGSNWIFSKPSTSQPLARQNEVHKGIWDTFYSVYVEPDCDVTITWDSSSLGGSTKLIVLISLVVTAALFVFIFGMLR